ncbi:hypothetical protein C451_01753 [Halococcus thailandensis JCM 13552]|uniref:Uncharacterized protein n=1 Tax=Halococcus thailandensis JCM 13552 TaxID=1227457 RepID=M0NGA0_9EURY|nr:hypothetical protein C451_01753 [Halococcus thailandensis JCM 13552]
MMKIVYIGQAIRILFEIKIVELSSSETYVIKWIGPRLTYSDITYCSLANIIKDMTDFWLSQMATLNCCS